MKINTNQLITSPTHHKPKCKSSLIDLVLTKTPEIITNIKQHPPIAKSHHQVITAQLILNDSSNVKNKNAKQTKIIKPNFEKANFDAINAYLQDENWEVILLSKKCK